MNAYIIVPDSWRLPGFTIHDTAKKHSTLIFTFPLPEYNREGLSFIDVVILFTLIFELILCRPSTSVLIIF